MPFAMPFSRPLHDAVEDRLLERVVEHGPRKELAFGVPRRRGEIEPRCESAGHVGVHLANRLVPRAAFVVRVVCLIIQHAGWPAAGCNARREAFELLPVRLRASVQA